MKALLIKNIVDFTRPLAVVWHHRSREH